MFTPDAYAFVQRCAKRIRIRPSFVDHDDCVQDCYVAYLENVGKYRPDCAIPLLPWLFRQIVAQVKRKYGLVRAGESADALEGLPAPRIDPDPRLDREAACDSVGLTPVERACVELRYDDGLTHQQIADRLGFTRPYISEVLSRAHDRIRCFFEGDLRPDPVEPDGGGRAPSGPRRKRGRPAGAGA